MANMFNLNTDFTFNLQDNLRKRGLEERGKIQQVIDSEVLRLNQPYVPFDTGELIRSGTANTQIGSGEVVYMTVYARKHYYIPMQHEGQRCAYWFEVMKSNGGKEKILSAVRAELSKVGE